MFELESAYLDVAAIEEGRWQELGADFPGVAILARGLTAPGAKKLRSHLRRVAPKSDRLSNGQLSDEAEDRILKVTIARECVLDWRGLASAGKPLAFSKETLEGIMNEPRARKIAAAIVNAIIDLEQTTVAAEDDIVGNSQAS
jgi:hypothetical protein